MSRPTVLVVDDFEPMATAIAGWLSRWYEVVGQIHRLAEVLPAVERTRPQVVVLDLAFRLETGLSLIPALTTGAAPAIVIVHTAYREHAALQAAAAAGAAGFVVKGSDFGELRDAIATALAGGRHFPAIVPDGPGRSRRGPTTSITPPYAGTPTDVEASILTMLAAGHSARQIGAILGRHHGAVTAHLTRCWRRLGMEGPVNREALVAWFRTSGQCS